jgi:protein-S-isoprenylcysteine O-methyltransferase Ste14
MESREEQENFFTSYKNKFSEYIEDRLLLLRLQLTDKFAKLAGMAISSLIIILLVFFILLFLSVLIGFLFSSLFHSYIIGFGIVLLIYIILLVIMIALARKKAFTGLIYKVLIDVLFEKNKDDDNEQPPTTK